MNRDFSIIDANINRAREGLRVVEDICRFVLRDRVLFEKIKEARHHLAEIEQNFGSASSVNARQGEDIGLEAVVESEYQRSSIYELLRANCSRAAESLRVLEELAKIYCRDKVYFIENCRYQVYSLERRLLVKTPHFWLRKYFEEGIVYPISDSVDELIWLVQHGAKVIQLRDKKSSRREVFEKARRLCGGLVRLRCDIAADKQRFSPRPSTPHPPFFYPTTPHPPAPSPMRRGGANGGEPVLLIVNDYIDIAARLPVAGVHLGADDAKIEQARRALGINKIIGASNGSVEQIRNSIANGADYVSLGPVFSTPTKPERRAIGLGVLRKCAREAAAPLVAIGGIDTGNVDDVLATGVRNIAVVRAGREFFKLTDNG
ncbi:MAG: thiamine phosphate synthase [Patescibacteria group bacterium]